MKMRPPGCLPGRTEEKISTPLATGFSFADAAVSSYDEVRMASLVVFGGGFLVARSSSEANEEEIYVLTRAVVTRKKTFAVVTAVKSSRTISCMAFSSFIALVFSAA